MNLFQLATKEEDEIFLSGSPVHVRIAIARKEWAQHPLVPGDKIVIMLSNRKKHMGRIARVDIVLEEPVTVGEMTIVRVASEG